MNNVTGQLYMQDMGDAHDRSGWRTMMVVGIIAVPQDHFIKDGHQYVFSDVGQFGDRTACRLHKEDSIDRKKEFVGMGASGILCAPIWRI